ATRNRIYKDWFAHYASRGIKNGDERIGNSVMLLPVINQFAKNAAENFHLMRVFTLIEYDNILDEFFL
ncbi:hypothetical protein AAVH_38933, partial [Aphelenchoides avenae]